MGTRQDAEAVHHRAQAWKRQQDPRLLDAFRRAFCHHHGRQHGHTCLRPSDRRIIAEWSARIVRGS